MFGYLSSVLEIYDASAFEYQAVATLTNNLQMQEKNKNVSKYSKFKTLSALNGVVEKRKTNLK